MMFSENIQGKLILKILQTKYPWITDIKHYDRREMWTFSVYIMFNPFKFEEEYGYEPKHDFEKENKNYKKSDHIFYRAQKLFYLYEMSPEISIRLKNEIEEKMNRLKKETDHLLPKEVKLDIPDWKDNEVAGFEIDNNSKK